MKLKTKRAAAKRFKVSGSGKIRMGHAYHSHILTKKSSKRKKKLSQWTNASPADSKKIKRMLLI